MILYNLVSTLILCLSIGVEININVYRNSQLSSGSVHSLLPWMTPESGGRACRVLRDCFSVIIVCLSTRLNGFVLCCVFSIAITLIGCVPCRTIKIPSESPICLPAMPAVRVPFLGSCQSLRLPCIIHEPQEFRTHLEPPNPNKRARQKGECCIVHGLWITLSPFWCSDLLWPPQRIITSETFVCSFSFNNSSWFSSCSPFFGLSWH